MIWACFIANKLGPIGFVKGMVNSDSYIQMMMRNFVPFVEALNEEGITNVEFQQDNATPYTPKNTRIP
jgi:hypothetical protein